MRKVLQDQAHSGFYYGMKAPICFEGRDVDGFRDHILTTVGNQRINYLEFGVFSGDSMRAILRRFTHPEARFAGFDSFEGLPEDWKPLPEMTEAMKAGTFSQQGRTPTIDDGRVSFVKGWFQNTLPVFLANGGVAHPCPHLVHFDADLYSATLFILGCLWPVLPEYYFICDEFMYDEVVAFRDFALSFPVEIKFLSQMGADRPGKVFGWMRRVPFTL